MTGKIFRIAMAASLCAGALTMGCAPAVPPELASARQAYQRASSGPAARAAPVELHKAQEALTSAERSFEDEPKAELTRDLAYVAERKAQLAEVQADLALENQKKAQAERDYQARQAQIVQQTQGELSQTREQLAEAERLRQQEARQLGSEREARLQAEQRAAAAEQRVKEAQESLARLAAVKEEQRGLVITLSGSVLFKSNEAALLPEAQTRLNQVAEALLATKERNIIVEGHTDSRGNDAFNLELSHRRAQAVRDYLVSRGYPPDKIQARGIGEVRPVADNTTAEGRANNRRVEIIVEPQGG